MMNGPTSHNFISQRLRLHYVTWGDPANEPLIFVHGIRDHNRTWDLILSEFADDYFIIAPDLRGHGESEWVNGSGYHYLDYVYDLFQLINQLGLHQVTLIGHSLGGAIVTLFAGVYPERVARLIAIEGIGLWSRSQLQVPAHEKIRGWVDANQQLASRRPRRYPDLDTAAVRMQEANPQLAEHQAHHLTQYGVLQHEDGTFSWKYDNYTNNFLSSFGLTDAHTIDLWRNIQCPVLLINAAEGLPHRIGHEETLEYFAEVELIDIQAAGHWTYHDQPDQVVGAMLNFLRPKD